MSVLYPVEHQCILGVVVCEISEKSLFDSTLDPLHNACFSFCIESKKELDVAFFKKFLKFLIYELGALI